MGTNPNPPLMSPEFLRRAERTASSRDPDRATAQTVAIMCRLIRDSVLDPLVWQAAAAAVNRAASAQLEPLIDEGMIATACYWFTKTQLRFVHHSKLIEAWFRERDQLQLLIEPAVLLRMPAAHWEMVGDCAIYSMLICAMLSAYQVPWLLVTLACDPRAPWLFTHVFPRALMADGSSLTLDASHGRYPGWQVPADHTFRSQEWDENGEPINV